MDFTESGQYYPLNLLQAALILMWLDQDHKKTRKNRGDSQVSPLNSPSEIQMSNGQKIESNFAKKQQKGVIPFHTPNNLNDPQHGLQKSWNKSLTIHPFDGEAAKRMVQTLKLTQTRMTQIKKECGPDCHCKTCLSTNLAQNSRIQNMKEVLWSGPLIIHPNTEKYRMQKATLTYQWLLEIPLDKNLTKIKYLIDKNLYVPVIRLTHGQVQTRLLPNRKEGITLFIQILLSYLAVHESFLTKFVVNDEAEGLIYRKYSLKGQWERVTVTIRRGTLKENTGEQRKFSSQCLWTSFKIMQCDQAMGRHLEGRIRIAYHSSVGVAIGFSFFDQYSVIFRICSPQNQVCKAFYKGRTNNEVCIFCQSIISGCKQADAGYCKQQ